MAVAGPHSMVADARRVAHAYGPRHIEAGSSPRHKPFSKNLSQEHPVKSISLGVIGGPGTALSGFPIESRLVVLKEGVQSIVPPLKGTNASALIV